MFKKLQVSSCVGSIQLMVATSLFWILFANFSLFSALLHDYPFNAKNAAFLATAAFGFMAVILIVLSLVCFRMTIKPILIVLLLTSSQAAYYMDTYHVMIDDTMLVNVLQTDTKEVGDLLNVKMFVYLFLLGILPSILVYRAKVIFRPWPRELLARFTLIGSLLLVSLVLYYLQSAVISSFFREHKTVRYHANPSNYAFALGRHINSYRRSIMPKAPLIAMGADARIARPATSRQFIIMVVGETARADRFSLNGYTRETNPLLKKQAVVSFTNVRSCATLTAFSVPCMFSNLTESGFSVSQAKARENLLDILGHVGVNILWRDNNSSSKGVSDRFMTQDYRDPQNNPICDEECRDEGMLIGLEEYIKEHPKGDIFVVLHSMGNHGPAYYKRYPKEFTKFTPECKTNELSDCTNEEINNAYDNAILYTDYFLNKTIEFLKQYDDRFQTALFYVSDHGESLGENSIYLHGLPNLLAPKEQRQVPMILWLGKNFKGVTMQDLRAKRDPAFSHDNIFHTMLGMMQIETKDYNKDLDITHQ